jgi:flagellar basal-body rod protein FlgF
LGGGVLVGKSRLSREQGPIEVTGRDLDAAIQGDGFFTVSARGAGNEQVTRYTRDGRFTLDGEGNLITVNGGHRVLDDQRRPIQLQRDMPVTIDSTGHIAQDGTYVARLGVVAPNLDSLMKAGEGLYLTEEKGTPAAAKGQVISGAVEGSGVDPVTTLTEMMETSRNVNSNTRLMQYHDQLMDQAINRFGRIA